MLTSKVVTVNVSVAAAVCRIRCSAPTQHPKSLHAPSPHPPTAHHLAPLPPTRPPTASYSPTHRYLRTRQDANEHTLAVIFDAYTHANRLDLALELWGSLRAERLDIGPIAASTLLRCCARARDVDAGLRVFEQLMRSRITFNRFAYNCIIHLCALAGRLEDAQGVYNLMRLETEESNLPDEFTYAGMVRAMLAAGKLEGLQTVSVCVCDATRHGVWSARLYYCHMHQAVA